MTLALALLATLQADGRGLYVWSEAKQIAAGEKAPADALLAFCKERAITRLYFMASGKEDLGPFLTAARAANVQVHAMHPGDMDEWLKDFPQKADPAPILDWVKAVRRQAFDGIHLDIEPAGSPHWKEHAAKLGQAYIELLARVRKEIGKATPLSAAVPHWWDRDELAIDVGGKTKPLIDHVLEIVDRASLMAYRGAKLEKVLEAIAHECSVKPERVELVLETDTSIREEGVDLHVGTRANLEAIFKGAVAKHTKLAVAIHHYTTYRTLPEK